MFRMCVFRMKLTPVKRLILETMWNIGKPLKPTEIAKEIGLGFPTVMMHLIGLNKMGYIETPEKGYYAINVHGKEAIGFPKLTKEKAEALLRPLPPEKAFHFYVEIGRSLGMYADSLQSFCENLHAIDAQAVEFHLSRGDFEAWIIGIGDIELARKITLIKGLGLHGNELKQKLYETVRERCEELAKATKSED